MDKLEKKRAELLELIKVKRVELLADIITNSKDYNNMSEEKKRKFEIEQMEFIDESLFKYIDYLMENSNENTQR